VGQVSESEFDEGLLLEQRADRLREGDQVFTPARRWETVTTAERPQGSCKVTVTTKTGRRVCTWRFGTWEKLPVLPVWRNRIEPKVRLWDGGRNCPQVVAAISTHDHSVYKGYELAAAYGKKGAGWEVYDNVADPAVPVAAGLSKARATTLVKQIAKQRAAEFGVAVDFAKAA
jgi:hypothetical protein